MLFTKPSAMINYLFVHLYVLFSKMIYIYISKLN